MHTLNRISSQSIQPLDLYVIPSIQLHSDNPMPASSTNFAFLLPLRTLLEHLPPLHRSLTSHPPTHPNKGKQHPTDPSKIEQCTPTRTTSGFLLRLFHPISSSFLPRLMPRLLNLTLRLRVRTWVEMRDIIPLRSPCRTHARLSITLRAALCLISMRGLGSSIAAFLGMLAPSAAAVEGRWWTAELGSAST